MSSIGSIASTVTTAANGLANLIFVSPQKTVGYQPQPAPGFSGTQAPTLVFHYEGEQTVTLESDITDHYVEDNTAIQDQISLKPEKITTHGFIGELNDIAPNSTLSTLQAAANKLVQLSPYTPGLSTSALIAYNEAAFLYSSASTLANSAVSTYSSITGGGGEAVINGNGLISVPDLQTKQQLMFLQFYGYWKNRTLFTVQTPWAVFENMAIVTLRAVQDAETNVITDFELTFKILRFANSVITTEQTYLNSQSPLSAQSAPSVYNSSTPTSVDLNFGSAINTSIL